MVINCTFEKYYIHTGIIYLQIFKISLTILKQCNYAVTVVFMTSDHSPLP